MSLIPKETECPVCNSIFIQPTQPQGGGRRSIYCSHRCASLDWVRGNTGSRKATILKYDNKPENKEKKRLDSRKRTLAKYNWTEHDLEKELQRQDYKCYGCLNSINRFTCRIDHDHVTNIVRGLLCDLCNFTLGHAKDTQGTLRRLMAYLDRDRTKKLIYLIGALKNDRIPEIGNSLRTEGFDVMDEWFTPGPEADLNWQKYEAIRGRSFEEAINGRSATNIFLFDRSYIDLSDYVVFVWPAGKSAFLELGYARGRNKPVYVLLDGQQPDRYDVMTKAATGVFSNLNDLIKELKETNGKTN